MGSKEDTIKLHIIGKLEPQHLEKLSTGTYRKIYNAVTKHGLYGIVSSGGWKQGVLVITHTNAGNLADSRPSFSPLISPIDFITRLTHLVRDKNLADLGLTGELTVMVPGLTPKVFRLMVKDGEVYHQQASFTWDTTTHIM
jgi:hypothetical protein